MTHSAIKGREKEHTIARCLTKLSSSGLSRLHMVETTSMTDRKRVLRGSNGNNCHGTEMGRRGKPDNDNRPARRESPYAGVSGRSSKDW